MTVRMTSAHAGPARFYYSTDRGHHWQGPFRLPMFGQIGLAPRTDYIVNDRHDCMLCLTYGYRAAPFGIRARISTDRGHRWGKEIILRDDGGGRDVGYPRSVQRPDGKVATVYYFHDRPSSDRYIAATIWDPNVLAADERQLTPGRRQRQ